MMWMFVSPFWFLRGETKASRCVRGVVAANRLGKTEVQLLVVSVSPTSRCQPFHSSRRGGRMLPESQAVEGLSPGLCALL